MLNFYAYMKKYLNYVRPNRYRKNIYKGLTGLKIVVKNLYRLAVIILAVLASVFTIISGILALQNADEFSKWFNEEFQTEQYWLAAANSLAPEVNVSLFDEKLGKPVFTSKLKGLENRTYVNDFFYTQVFVDESNTVRLFSVTVRKDEFYPNIPYFEHSENKLKLGKIKFNDFRNISSPLAAEYIPGFRRSIYSEMHYFGNPGNYLYYFLTINDAGLNYGTDLSNVKAFSFKDSGLFDGCDQDIVLLGNYKENELVIEDELSKAYSLTKDKIPNTYTVTDRSGLVFCEYRDFFENSPIIILGPNLDKVRLLR